MDMLLNYAPLALLLPVALLLWRLFARRARALPYTRRGSLLTAGEMRFYRTPAHAVPEGLLVMVKVRLMDVLFVDDGAWKEFGAPASGMHVDFVPADAGTLDVRDLDAIAALFNNAGVCGPHWMTLGEHGIAASGRKLIACVR